MEHVNAEILRAIADGEKVQYRHFSSPLEWKSHDNEDTVLCWKLLAGSDIYEWRIAPKTIKIGDCEVPEPCRVAPKVGQEFWAVNPFAGPQQFTWDGSKEDHHALKSGFVLLTKEAAEKHCEVSKNLLAKK